jgi:ribose 5-phosphate isomerase B
MRIILGGDEHDPLIDVITDEIVRAGHEVEDVGARVGTPRAWAEVALEVAGRVASRQADRGVVCCYTGTGVAMAANKVPGVRAALCADAVTARGARQWNDANVLALSFRLTAPTVAREIVRAFLETPYDDGEGPSLAAMERAERTSGEHRS